MLLEDSQTNRMITLRVIVYYIRFKQTGSDCPCTYDNTSLTGMLAIIVRAALVYIYSRCYDLSPPASSHHYHQVFREMLWNVY